MKYAVMITFSNGTTRYVTGHTSRSFDYACNKEAEYHETLEDAIYVRENINSNPFNMMHPIVVCCRDNESLANKTYAEETEEEEDRLVQLQHEKFRRAEQAKEA